jgi:hypothetical protein
MLTVMQINWAKSHDWFGTDHFDGSITVIDRYSQKHPDGSITHHVERLHWTKGFSALRDWAGY